MMKCGCQAQGTNKSGDPVCVVHAGLVPGWNVVDEAPPSLVGRVARCSYCRKETPSDQPLRGYTVLPFFVHHPKSQFDEFYCGCMGWD